MSTSGGRASLDRLTVWMVVLACLAPTLLSALSFHVVPQWPQAVRRPLFFLSKVLQFGLPILWLVLLRRVGLRSPPASGTEVAHRGFTAFQPRPPSKPVPNSGAEGTALAGVHSWQRPDCGDRTGDRSAPGNSPRVMSFPLALMLAAAFGLAVGGAIVLGYPLLFAGHKEFRAATEAVGRLLAGYRVTGMAGFVVVGAFYSLVHSALEEYYWRWFVFGQMRRALPLPAAIAVSSIAFTLHHLVPLGYYFGWGSPLQLLFALAVAVGGAFWAWLYHGSQSLPACWLSHLIVDGALFTVGYWMVAPMLQVR